VAATASLLLRFWYHDPLEYNHAVARTYVSLDLETTGLNPDRDAIIEVGAVKFRGDKALETWSSLVRPERPIPYRSKPGPAWSGQSVPFPTG
jgi:DNA polymerase III epsilon subunit-like protein